MSVRAAFCERKRRGDQLSLEIFRGEWSAAYAEVDGDGGLDLGGLAVEQEGTIAGLANRGERGLAEECGTAENMGAFDAAGAGDEGVDDDGAFGVGGDREGRVLRTDGREQQAGDDS